MANNKSKEKNREKNIIECQKVSKYYNFGSEQVKAIDCVDLQIAKGEFVAIMGKSGSGKTTLINILAGLASPTNGSVLIDHEHIENMSANQLSMLRREKIGIIFQMYNLHPGLTIIENVELPLVFVGTRKNESRTKAEQLLIALGLEDYLDNYPEELSGGEQQRVAIARALISDPLILLADEPTGNLNSALAFEIVKLLKELNEERGLTIVFVTHNEALVDNSMTTIKLADGKILNE